VNGFFDVTLSAAQLSIDYAGEMVGHSKPDLILLGEAGSKEIAPALSLDALETLRPAVAATKSFDFPGGGLGYFDVRLTEIYEFVHGIEGNKGCFPDFTFGARNQEILEAIDDSIWFLGLH
jgi:hypothetical protein